MSPVTHTALVAVNNAVTSGAEPGPSRAIGSISSPVPTATATANAATITWAGWRNPAATGAGRGAPAGPLADRARRDTNDLQPDPSSERLLTAALRGHLRALSRPQYEDVVIEQSWPGVPKRAQNGHDRSGDSRSPRPLHAKKVPSPETRSGRLPSWAWAADSQTASQSRRSPKASTERARTLQGLPDAQSSGQPCPDTEEVTGSSPVSPTKVVVSARRPLAFRPFRPARPARRRARDLVTSELYGVRNLELLTPLIDVGLAHRERLVRCRLLAPCDASKLDILLHRHIDHLASRPARSR